MSVFGGLFNGVFGKPVSEREIRAEAWALGSRHRGDVLTGARAELAAEGLPFRRAMLLRAVIRSHTLAATVS